MKQHEEVKKLYRSRTDKIIAGVCGGLGKYFDIDPVLVRIIFVLLVFAHGLGILLYLILMIVIPKEPGEEVEIDRQAKIKEFAHEAGERARAAADEIGREAQMIAGEFKGASPRFSEKRTIIGAIIVVIGAIILLNLLIPIPGFFWKLIWPIVIILIGLYVIFKKPKTVARNRQKKPGSESHRESSESQNPKGGEQA